MRIRNLLAVYLVFFCSYTTANTYIFSLDFCEFSVGFPLKYKTYELIVGEEKVLSARARPNESTGLHAECWPYPQEKHVPIETFAQRLGKEMQQRGMSVNSVIIDKNSKIAPQIILSGFLRIEGKQMFIKSVIFLGSKSRLELLVVEQEIVSNIQVNFRNSVTRK